MLEKINLEMQRVMMTTGFHSLCMYHQMKIRNKIIILWT